MDSHFILPIILQAVGVGVIIAEFILPSGGLLTLTAIGAFSYSVFYMFTYVSTGAGMYLIAGDVILIPLAIVAGIKLITISPVTLRKSLSRENGVTSQDSALQSLVGKHGKTLTDLRPSGKAGIDGHRFDVVSAGDYIEKDDEIAVSAVSGNRIVVRLVK
ncbi:MAG: serine protease [Deltaproteobacteria bacterium]|nr:MAG: serine protease [Deltaproteobacteria bacterium]